MITPDEWLKIMEDTREHRHRDNVVGCVSFVIAVILTLIFTVWMFATVG